MIKPTALPVQFDNIPMELKRIPRWVLWRFVLVGENENKKWAKLPAQTSGQSASSTNPDTWTDFLAVQEAYQKNPNKFDGIGFVFDGTDNLVGVDLDDCYDAEQGSFTNVALQHIAESLQGYMEVSPSGTGVKIFTRADTHNSHVDHDKGFEFYPKGRYFTVTGHLIGGTIPTDIQDLSGVIPDREIRKIGRAHV